MSLGKVDVLRVAVVTRTHLRGRFGVASSAAATTLTSSRRPEDTLRTLCLSSGRRGRNEKRRSKRHIVGPWVIAGRERHDQAGHYFAWRAPGCVASRRSEERRVGKECWS